jgi:hypothetical protein
MAVWESCGSTQIRYESLKAHGHDYGRGVYGARKAEIPIGENALRSLSTTYNGILDSGNSGGIIWEAEHD